MAVIITTPSTFMNSSIREFQRPNQLCPVPCPSATMAALLTMAGRADSSTGRKTEAGSPSWRRAMDQAIEGRSKQLPATAR